MSVMEGDGDGVVPVASSLRANSSWFASMAAKGLDFKYFAYK